MPSGAAPVVGGVVSLSTDNNKDGEGSEVSADRQVLLTSCAKEDMLLQHEDREGIQVCAFERAWRESRDAV